MEENKYQKGFTLVELLTTIFIIVVLSTIAFLTNRQNIKQYTLLRSANKLAQDIRTAQQMAMTTKTCPVGTPYCGGNIPKGYGIYLESGRIDYILYADIDGDEYYDSSDDVIIQIIPLESGVEIQSVNPSPLSINYKPPDPTTKISNGSIELDEGIITLVLQSDPLKTKTVKVNKFGLIQVE